jgi:predicted nucleic acid-binding protein
MILVDSSVWIDFFRGTPTTQVELLDALLGTEPLAIGDLILAEVLQGFRSDRDFNQARQLLLTFEMVNIVDSQTAIQAAKNFRALRTKGITVRKTVDTLIATCCLQKGHILLHSDRDFEPFATHLGLRVAYHGA